MELDQERNLKAKLWHAKLGDIGEGSITYGYNCFARFTLDGLGHDLDLTEDQLIEGLQAIADNGQRLSLFNCECRGRTLYPSFVVDGDVQGAQFQNFEVRYSNVSEWFFQQMAVQGTPGVSIEWQTLPPPLVAEVAQHGHHFKSESFYVGSLAQAGEDRNLHQHFEFRFSALQSSFSLKDIEHYARRFSNLLSLLLAHPCSIVSVDVFADGKRGARLYYGVFNSTKNQTKSDDNDGRINWHTFLTWKGDIDDCWDSVVNKFFSSGYREVIWSRLAGMQNYEGFWEYHVLGYVTLLDSYVSQAYKKGTATQLTKKLRRLEDALRDVQPSLDPTQHSDVMSKASNIFTSDTSFESKFHKLLNELDTDVRKVVNLSPTDFDTIKELRDEIAHGQQPSFTGPDFTPISVIVNRITLLLTYLFFCDVGLGRDTFLHGLEKSFSKLRRHADIDTVHLARVLRPSTFYSVSAQEMAVIRNRSRRLHCACFTRDHEGRISYSEQYSEASVNNLRMRHAGRHHELLDLPEDAVNYVGDAYFEDGTHTEKVHSAILIDLSRVPV